MERLAKDPLYFAKPDRALFQDIRRYFPITAQAQVAWAVQEGVDRGGRVHRGADRGRRARRRRRPLPRDDAQGQAVPAHAAARARLLPVAPAPRSRTPRRSLARLAAQSRGRSDTPPCRLGSRVSHDTDKLIRQLSLVAFLMAERRPLTARDVKSNVEGYSGDVGRGVRAALLLRPRGAALARRAAPVAARRVHGRGAVHAPLRAVLPAPARARGRRARGAPDGALPARGQVRVRGAAAARAAEPRARPARLRRGADRDRRARRGARPGLLAGDAGPARRSSRARSRSSAR